MRILILTLSMLISILSACNYSQDEQKLDSVITNEVIAKPKKDSIAPKKTVREEQIANVNSIKNEALKDSILLDLYVSGILKEREDSLVFNFIFDVPCGDYNPVIYSLNIDFTIANVSPLQFPKKLPYYFQTAGLKPAKDSISYHDIFELILVESGIVCYYSPVKQSALIFLSSHPYGKYYYLSAAKKEAGFYRKIIKSKDSKDGKLQWVEDHMDNGCKLDSWTSYHLNYIYPDMVEKIGTLH